MFEKNWQELIRPTKIEIEKKDSAYVKFSTEPFERGYGVTIGNSLRRVLLSSIMGAAITSVWIDSVDHEFSTVRGVKEDVTEIILNLKKVVVRMTDDKPALLKIDVKGKREVKAGDITHDGGVEVVNPDLHIATLSSDSRLYMEMRRDSVAVISLRNRISTMPTPSAHTRSMQSFAHQKSELQRQPGQGGPADDYDKLSMRSGPTAASILLTLFRLPQRSSRNRCGSS